MLILDTVGDTIRAEASAATSITVTCYGIETASGSESYKKLGQSQLTGSGTQDIVYTVPASTLTLCSVVIIANTSATAKTVKLWHVPNGGSPGDSNALLGTIDIESHTTMVWNKGNVQTIPDQAGLGMLKSVYDADEDGLIDQASGGTELDTSGVTNGQLLIGNTTGNVFALASLTGTANQITVTPGASSITLSAPQNIHTGATPTFANLTIGAGQLTCGSITRLSGNLLLQAGAGNTILTIAPTYIYASAPILLNAGGYAGLGASYSRLIFDSTVTAYFANAKVGVGVTPTFQFHVKGTATGGTNVVGAFTDSADVGFWVGAIGGVAGVLSAYGSAQQLYIQAGGTSTGIALYAGGTEKLRVGRYGNIGISVSTFGTSATNSLAILSGTAPAGNLTDTIQLYSNDFAAGKACLHIRGEDGTIVKLQQQAKANYNNWAAFGDVVNALVAMGIFDAA